MITAVQHCRRLGDQVDSKKVGPGAVKAIHTVTSAAPGSDHSLFYQGALEDRGELLCQDSRRDGPWQAREWRSVFTGRAPVLASGKAFSDTQEEGGAGKTNLAARKLGLYWWFVRLGSRLRWWLHGIVRLVFVELVSYPPARMIGAFDMALGATRAPVCVGKTDPAGKARLVIRCGAGVWVFSWRFCHGGPAG